MAIIRNLFKICTVQRGVKLMIINRYNNTGPSKPIDKTEIEKMVKGNKIVIFMKGTAKAPKCGFSNAVVQVMRMHGVQYESYDVLQNDELRQGIKDFTDWPTIPQVFINGEFIGGCDILLQMHKNGDFIEELKKCGIRSALLDKQNE